ncbi:ribosomal protein S18-alanine N-acetyltransferase [Aquifex sp.]
MLKVREMTLEDIEEVFRINRENFTTDAWSRFAFEKEFENKFSKRFVLELDGRVVGYIIYWVVRDEATIMTFAIDKEHQNRGYGEFLLRESLKKINAKRILLDVRKTNLRAINLYRKLGFRLVSERKAYYSDGENALFMELRQ